MEIQIIHYGQTKGDIAKQAVVSFLFEKQPGVYNKFIDDLDFFNLPNPLQKSRKLYSSVYIPKLFYEAHSEEIPLMKPFSFYSYQGSITNPPCTERTIHYVASKPFKLSTTALQLFEEAIRVPDVMDSRGNVRISKQLPQNNRLIQKLNGRAVFWYDHIKYCGPDPIKKPVKPKGHYEKKINKND